jgi:hypothetical protein
MTGSEGVYRSGSEGISWLTSLRKRWVLLAAAKVLLLSLATAIFIGALLVHFLDFGPASFIIVFVLSFGLLSILVKYWQISLEDICRFVNSKFPEVEESAGLLVLPSENRTGLQQLQASRVNQLLASRDLPNEPFKQLRYPAIALILSLIFLFLITKLPASQNNSFSKEMGLADRTTAVVKERVPAEISSYSISITPPGYTGKSRRVQKQFTIVAESGASIHWNIQTSQPIKTMSLIWNDKETWKLAKADQQGSTWSLNKVLLKPGFYQVLLNGKRSDLYQVEIISDQPVAIKLIDPEQHSTIDVGRPKQVGLKLILTDDYGISDGYISATVASGKGEAVNFKETKIPLKTSFNNQRSIQVTQQLLLSGMGMNPGDELYFYINAKDNHGQQSRSDMYFVSIQDTTELMSMAAMDNGVNLVPEYFRSQRQIIIDTEKLLKERATLSETDFKNRSNDLGIDQKMLRLRYGKFLGEESETSIGGEHTEEKKGAGKSEEHEHAEHQAEPAEFGNVQAIMDQYAHKHDQAEDATFFEPEMKAQLKATLNEMWSSELQLRTFAPLKALPFEYKALRLLKDLQQKSRAFVAKTTIKTTALKMEKRLSGELDKVTETNSISKNSRDAKSSTSLQQALTLLEARSAGQAHSTAAIPTLQMAEKQLVGAAAKAPSRYLPALKGIKSVISAWNTDKQLDEEIAQTEKGINSLLGNQQVKPNAPTSQPSDLTKAYFNQLNRSSR